MQSAVRRGALVALPVLAVAVAVLVVGPSGTGAAVGTSKQAFAADEEALAREYQISAATVASDVATSLEATGDVIPSSKASAVASSTVGFTADSSPLTPALVRFTDANYGEDSDRDGEDVSPYFKDTLAWLVAFHGVDVPILYPIGKEGPPSYEATVFVFVDARTGGLIEAVTI